MKREDILLDDLADVVYAHSFHSRISISKSHFPLDIIEWDIFFRFIEGPKIRSSTTYVALENSIDITITLRKALVLMSAIHKTLKDIAECIDSFKNLNLRVICKWGRQCCQILIATGKELVDILSEAR
jgi:hypothetical protein